MTGSGLLKKMRVEWPGPEEEVRYFLPLDTGEIFMNELIGHTISLSFYQEIHCIHCGRRIKKTFAQGYCYPCFIKLPETDKCILHPEKCQAHLGISRDMEWSKDHCLRDHYVYLAVTSGLKVGVTRETQIPTRWIDQGAIRTLRIAKTPNRYLAGTIEVFLKDYLADKTNWRSMLTGDRHEGIDLFSERDYLLPILKNKFHKYLFDDNDITMIKYPVLSYPGKIQSVSFDKQHSVHGKLTGIKGQYLLFENGEVINIRKHGGYVISLSA
jgi:hypothetical protein